VKIAVPSVAQPVCKPPMLLGKAKVRGSTPVTGRVGAPV